MTTPAGGARERVRLLVDAGRYAEAVAAAREGLATDPEDVSLTVLLAISLCEERRHDEALAAAQRAVSLAPDSAWAQRTLGWIVYRLGRYAEAADLLTKSLTLNPHDEQTHIMLAETRLKQASAMRVRTGAHKQLLAQAEHHAAEAVRLEPSEAGGYLAHGKVAIAENLAGDAERWARQGLALEPDNSVGHQILGLAAQLRGDTRTAADHFVHAGKLNPRSRTSLNLLRSLRRAAPLSGIAVYVVLRLLSGTNRATGGAAAGLILVAVVAVIGVYVYFLFFGGRWRARRQMSEEARRALARDRQLHRRR